MKRSMLFGDSPSVHVLSSVQTACLTFYWWNVSYGVLHSVSPAVGQVKVAEKDPLIMAITKRDAS